MARTEIVVGATALSASLAAGTGSVQLDAIGGYQTFNSSSYHSGHTVPGGFLRPDSDISASVWSPSPAWTELTGSVGEITSSNLSSLSPSSSALFLQVGLGGINPSDRNKPVSITVSAGKSGSFELTTGSLGDSTASLTVVVVEGLAASGIDRASTLFENIGAELADFSFILTEAERFSIGNWSDVSIRTEFSMSVATASSTVNGRVAQVSVQFEGGVNLIEAPPVDAREWRLTWEV